MNILFLNLPFSNQYRQVCKDKTLFNSYIENEDNQIVAFSNLDFYLKYYGKLTLNLGSSLSKIANYFISYDGPFSNRTNVKAYFITNWEMYNNVLEIEYEIDIWHTYWRNTDWKIIRGIQSRSAILDYSREYSYPIELNIKEELPYNPYEDKYDIIAEVIRYTLTNDGTQGEINCYTGYISYYDNPNNETYNFKNVEWNINFTEHINKFLQDQSSGRNTNEKTYYYSINKIYVIRNGIFNIPPQETQIVTLSGDGTASTVDFVGWVMNAINNYNEDLELLLPLRYGLKRIVSQQNKYVYGVGTINHIFVVPNDGIFYNPILSIKINNNGFSIILRVGDMYEDISDDLTLTLPYDVTDASSRALRDISTKLQAAQGQYMITSGAANIMQSALSSPGNVISSLQKGGIFNVLGTGISSLGNLGGGILRGGAQIQLGNEQMDAAYTNRFSPVTPKKGSSSSYIANCKVNISYWCGELSNEDESDEAISNIGYKVAYLNTDIYGLDSVENKDYIPVKYDYINITGNLPNQFTSKIEEILMSGVHILCK